MRVRGSSLHLGFVHSLRSAVPLVPDFHQWVVLARSYVGGAVVCVSTVRGLSVVWGQVEHFCTHIYVQVISSKGVEMTNAYAHSLVFGGLAVSLIMAG